MYDNDVYLYTVIPGVYIRQVREPSLTDPSVFILLCEYLTVYVNSTTQHNTVYYMDGDSCVNTAATPILMETIILEPISMQLINQTVPVSDDTRSDWLGVYDLPPSDDTASRLVIYVATSFLI